MGNNNNNNNESTGGHETAVRKVLEEVVTQLLAYRPEEPLAFIVETLDGLCDDNCAVAQCQKLRLTHLQEGFLDEAAEAYVSLAAKRKSTFAFGQEVSNFVRRLAPLSADAVEEFCPPDEPVDFEAFTACVRTALIFDAFDKDLTRLFDELCDSSVVAAVRDEKIQLKTLLHRLGEEEPNDIFDVSDDSDDENRSPMKRKKVRRLPLYYYANEKAGLLAPRSLRELLVGLGENLGDTFALLSKDDVMSFILSNPVADINDLATALRPRTLTGRPASSFDGVMAYDAFPPLVT